MRKKFPYVLAVFIFSLLFVNLIGTTAAADEFLAQQYAPILYFEKDETCFPVEAFYHIDNSYLYQVDTTQPIDMNPSVETLANYTEDSYYLDNQKGTIYDSGIINDYRLNNLDSYTVYAHVVTTAGRTVIQYWMFYAFNPGTMNQHEGDWEMVQVVISGEIPTQVMFSQHHAGQKAHWDQVDKDSNNVKVYVSRGSHANYMRPYSGVVGVANDIVADNGKKLTPSDYNLVMLESQPWLDFAGRWGWYGLTEEEAEKASLLGQAGPNGPKFREDGTMWNDPLGWGEGLFQADNNVFILELILYNFVTLFIIFTIIIVAILVFRIYRRHKKTGLGPRIISMFYIDGVNAKSIGNILCIIGIIIAIYSLIIPWYVISTDIGISGYETEGMADMMTIDGIKGIQIQVPGLTGPLPMGSFTVPFSLLIGISLVFLIFSSIGIHQSKKLGKKYASKGVRLFIPFILIFIIIMALGMIPFESFADVGDASVDIDEVVGAISGSPFGGQKIVSIPDVDGQIELQWGYSLGGYLLLISGIVLVISGIMEVIANTTFFEEKIEKKQAKKEKEEAKKSDEKPMKDEKKTEKSDEKKDD
jgi:hypothetical protein